MAAGMGFFEMSFLMLVMGIGGSGGVMGLPPGERDAKFVQCAPEDVAIYAEWSARGEGKAGAPGIDGLAADPEIRQFVAAVKKAIFASIDNEVSGLGGEPEVVAKNMPRLMLLLLNRAGCLHADVDAEAVLRLMQEPPDLPPFTPEFFGFLPAVKATVVINGAGEADQIAKHLGALLDLIPGADRGEGINMHTLPIPLEGVKMTIHRHENYFILGWGEGTVERAIAGLKGEAKSSLKNHKGFAAAFEKLSMDRVGSLGWLNIAGLKAKAIKTLGPQGAMIPQMAKILGVDGLEHAASCTGVVDGQVVSRSFLKTGGTTEGLLSLAAGRALTPSDFGHVPADADLTLGISLNLPKILAAAKTIVATADPNSSEQFEAILKQLEKELGMTLEGDLFPAFDDVWTLYDSPSAGGVLVTNAVLGLKVKDEAKAKAAFDKLMEIFKLALPGEIRGGRFGRGVYLAKKSFMDHDVYFVNTVGDDDIFFAPAFCLTKGHLLASFQPQALKAHLRYAAGHGESAAGIVEKSLPKGESIGYCHADAPLVAQALVGITPYIAQIAFSEIQRDGTPIDLFSFPSPRAILPYMSDSLSRSWRTADGIMWESKHAIPLPGASSVMMQMPIFLGLTLGANRQFEDVAPALEAVEEAN